MTETSPRHRRDNTKTTPRHHQKKTETRPRHDRDTTETSPRQDRDILGEFFSGACAAPGRLIHVRPQAYRYWGKIQENVYGESETLYKMKLTKLKVYQTAGSIVGTYRFTKWVLICQYPTGAITKSVLCPRKILYEMTLERIKGKLDQNLSIYSKISFSTKRGGHNLSTLKTMILVFKCIYIYIMCIYIHTEHKATHFVEEIGRGILLQC